MASFNKITIVGYCGRDPELKYTPQGTAVCNFSIATTEKRKDTETTTWFRVTAFGRLAEVVNEYVQKGKQVYVEGRLRQDEYTDRDGNKRTTLDVTASEVQFLGSRSDSGDSHPAQSAKAAAFNAQKPVDVGADDDSVPF